MQNPITKIRSAGFTKVNQLVRAARYFRELQPAFAEWNAGEVYVCKKTGDYRYRFGDTSKSVAPWSSKAREVFPSPSALAFAAMVLGGERPAKPVNTTPAAPRAQATQANRVNVLSMAA